MMKLTLAMKPLIRSDIGRATVGEPLHRSS
jgi:hypothetical protein